METRISDDELAESVSDVLRRVRARRESFLITQDGQAVATLRPPETRPRKTFLKLASKLRDARLLPVDDKFADDLEAIQASQPMIGEPPSWDS